MEFVNIISNSKISFHNFFLDVKDCILLDEDQKKIIIHLE